MKKIFALVVALVMIVSSTAFAAVELELNYWSSEQEPGITALVNAFNESQDEIVVTATVVPWGQFWDKLNVGLPAGSAPDIFTLNALNVVDYAKNGYLLDITDLFESGAVDLSKFPESAKNTYTINGTLWAVPKDYDNIAVFYNKSMFDAAGIAYPESGWTYDEFVEIAAALTDKDAGIYGAGMTAGGQGMAYHYIPGNGGEIFGEDGTCVINSEQNVETLTKLAEAFGTICPTVEEYTELDNDTRFQSGMIAMIMAGSWNVAQYSDVWGEDLGIVELPVMKENKTTSHSLGWCAAATTQHPDEVKAFLTFCGTEEAGEILSTVVIPAYSGADDLWAAQYESVGAGVFIKAAREGWTVQLPAAANNAAEVFNRFNDYIAEMMSGADIAETLAAMETELNALIAG